VLLVSGVLPIRPGVNVAQPSDKFVIGAHGKNGMFSILFCALNNIAWAKKNGKIPVVYWAEDTPYFQKEGYHGQSNVWEYYFEPVSHLSYEPGDEVRHEYSAPDKAEIPHGERVYDHFFHTTLRNEWHEVLRDNVRLKPHITAKVEDFYQTLIRGRIVIGIHLRGTDKHSEARVVSPEAILKRAKQLAKSMGVPTYFFVATDEERLLTLAKKRLGADKVLAYNSVRSRNGSPVHYNPQGHAAEVGEQVLIEALLLSRCDYFFHTTSNVATGVLFFNPQLKSTLFVQDVSRGLLVTTNP